MSNVPEFRRVKKPLVTDIALHDGCWCLLIELWFAVEVHERAYESIFKGDTCAACVKLLAQDFLGANGIDARVAIGHDDEGCECMWMAYRLTSGGREAVKKSGLPQGRLFVEWGQIRHFAEANSEVARSVVEYL